MAQRDIAAAFNANTSDFITKIRDASDGPGGTPYPDGRVLASYLSGSMQMFRLPTIVLGTDVDDDGDVISASDDLTVTCPFVPELVVVHSSVTGLAINSRGFLPAETFALDATPALDDGIEFLTGANIKKFTIKNATDVWTGTPKVNIFAFGFGA